MAASHIELRPFTPADLEQAFQLDQVCFPPGIAYSQSELASFIRKRGAYAIVAEKSGHPSAVMAGFLIANRNSRSSQASITTVDVAPAQRRHGIAALLLQAAESHLRDLGCTELSLEVAVDNLAAQALYMSRGFIITARRRGYYNSLLDAFTMRKPL